MFSVYPFSVKGQFTDGIKTVNVFLLELAHTGCLTEGKGYWRQRMQAYGEAHSNFYTTSILDALFHETANPALS